MKFETFAILYGGFNVYSKHVHYFTVCWDNFLQDVQVVYCEVVLFNWKVVDYLEHEVL